MSIRHSKRSIAWMVAVLLSLLLITILVSCSAVRSVAGGDSSSAEGQGREPVGAGTATDRDFSGEGTPLSSCPKGPFFIDVEMIESWTWSPGGHKELGKIVGWGRVTCMVEVSGSKVTGEVGCYFQYDNNGILQGNPGSCNITGQGVAIATIKGSCDNSTVTLQIDESVVADEETGDVPMTAKMECGGKTFPYITYFPMTWFEVDVPLTAKKFEYSIGTKDCPSSFIECDKIYTFSLRNPEALNTVVP